MKWMRCPFYAFKENVIKKKKTKIGQVFTVDLSNISPGKFCSFSQ